MANDQSTTTSDGPSVNGSGAAPASSSDQKRTKRRNRRWGDAPPASSTATPSVAIPATTGASQPPPAAARERKRKKSRFSSLPPSDAAAPPAAVPSPAASAEAAADPKAKAAALQASISQRLAALRARKSASSAAAPPPPSASAASSSSSRKRAADETGVAPTTTKRAKTYDLDYSITAPLFRTEQRLPKKAEKVNPYLAHVEEAKKGPSPGGGDDDVGAVEADAAAKAKAGAAADDDEIVLLDSRLAGGQVERRRARHKPIRFVEPGTFVELAERRRRKAENAQQSGFVSGRKAGTFVKSLGMDGGVGGAYGEGEAGGAMLADDDALASRPDASADGGEGNMPYAMEWWDVELLPGKLKREVASREGKALADRARERMAVATTTTAAGGVGDKGAGGGDEKDGGSAAADDERDKARRRLASKCYTLASLANSKTSALVQHPVPVKTPGHERAPPAPQPVLHLTKKEMKRQRKLRRAEKRREIQDLQAAGLVPPPEPRLTLSNFMKVLGDQAVMDPSKMESKVNEQIQARKIKHEKMNEERKLTKEQRSAKRARKLEEDTTESVSVALFLVKDMGHVYHRTKVDLNAQQNSITGGVLECENPALALVIAEGGPRAVKRYTRLMMVRMKWKGEGFEDGDSDDDADANVGDDEGAEKTSTQKFNPNNTCELVWTGMGAKRMFNSFVFQSCATSDAARKVLEAKGVAHFWDQVLIHASGRGEAFHFKLGSNEEEDDDGDVVMGGL